MTSLCPLEEAPAADREAGAAATSGQPMLAEWTGPFGGVPAFGAMDLAAIEPAFEAAMEEYLRELQEIAHSAEPAGFESTLVALEKSASALRRLYPYYGVLSSSLSSPEFREIQERLAPRLAAFYSKIHRNRQLFERVRSVYEGEEIKERSAAEQRLALLLYEGFTRNGATLEGEARERYGAIDERLAELHTRFANNVLADEEKYTLFLEESQMAGLPDSFKAAAAMTAEKSGQAGKFAVLNTRSSVDPYLTYAEDRAMRERVWRNYYSRGDHGDENDNNAVIAEILQLRHERVGLLGYENYGRWRLENRMAKCPERALELMESLWPAALARVEEEVADMQRIADAEGTDFKIAPWDYRFYAEKVRQATYDLDSDEVKQYLQLDKLREAMFFVAGELFGLEFTAITDGSVPVFHEDVRVFGVTDRQSGDAVGVWYLDPFARPGKRSGAWASTYRGHATVSGHQPVLSSNNSNFIKGAPGEPVLISWSDAETYFHEFGHALHALSSKVDYPSLYGGVRDYIEFQSQLLERWLLTDPVIEGFLLHHETGEPMPASLVEKIRRAATFNEGFATAEYLASALVDMRFHTVDPAGLDVGAFERETLAELNLPEQIVMRHRSPHFSHIFASEGYSAGYYGYLWADVLTADAVEAFAEAPGGFYDREVAAKMVELLFAPGNSIDPADAFRAFRGRDAEIGGLLRARGFPVPEGAS